MIEKKHFLPESERRDNTPDITAALLILLLMAAYYYGARALAVAAVCAAVCAAADALCLILSGRPIHIKDLSAVATGLSIAVMLPASVSFSAAALASLFAICVAKHPFGGHGCEIVNCAAAGFIFAALSFPSSVLMYPAPFAKLPLADTVGDVQLFPFAAAARSGSELELLIGNFSGPMGCTVALLTAAAALLLILRRAISATVLLSELGVIALFEFLTGGSAAADIMTAGGMLIFPAAFLTAESSLLPAARSARLIYGLSAGLITVIIMTISDVQYPAVYAAVLAAPTAGLSDGFGRTKSAKRRAKSIFGASNDRQISETIEMVGENRYGK